MAGTTCLLCSDNFIVNKKCITCNFCDNKYHLHCVKVKDQLYKSVGENKNFLWFCDTCIPNISSKLKTQSKEDLIEKTLENTQKILSVLNEKTHCANVEERKLYSEVLNNNLIIKPKINQNSKITKTEVIQKINPTDISASIRNVKEINNGRVIISCEDKKSLEILKNQAENELRENYLVETVNRKPQIKVTGIEECTLNDENFVKSIKMQNLLNEQSDLKIVHKYKSAKNNTYNVILEVEGDVFNNIIKKGRLFIGWRSYAVYEYVSVLRCFNCWRYGHKIDKCTNKKTCPICNGSDCVKEKCNSNKKECTNCRYAHDHLRLTHIDFMHTVFDKSCVSYQKMVNRAKSNIAYI